MLGARASARVIVVSLILALIPTGPAQATHKDKLEQTRREIRSTRARLQSAVQSDAQVRAELSVITTKLTAQRTELSQARARLHQLDLKIRAQKRRMTRLRAEQDERRSALAARARAMYMMGPGDAFQALTTAHSIEEFVGRAGALEMVSNADLITIEELQSVKFEARRINEELKQRRAEAEDVRDEIAQRVRLVAEMAAVQRAAHTRLTRKIDQYQDEIKSLEREQSRILAIIRSRQSTSTGPISKSGFIWPIRGPITSPYGPRWGSYHTGMDIDCRTGNPIKASKKGVVIESGWGGGYGNMIIVDHGNGVSTLYAHMSRLYVGRGTSVARGKVIGACGTTGNSTGDHLHFEVRINGRHTNPRPYLP